MPMAQEVAFSLNIIMLHEKEKYMLVENRQPKRRVDIIVEEKKIFVFPFKGNESVRHAVLQKTVWEGFLEFPGNGESQHRYCR